MAKTFLLVEDDPNDAHLMREVLKETHSSANIHVEHNGLNAVLYLKGEVKFANRDKYPIPDAILLDLEMPFFDGFEFLGWLRKEAQHQQIPVIVVTGSNRSTDIARVYELGAKGVVLKSSNWGHFKRKSKRA